MKHLSLRAIALATLGVIGVDIIVGMLLAALFDLPVFEADTTEQQQQAIIAAMAADTRYLFFSFLAGTASTVLGGYLAARLAARLPYYHALAFGVVALALGALSVGLFPLWFQLLGLGLTIPAALLGGHWAKRAELRPS